MEEDHRPHMVRGDIYFGLGDYERAAWKKEDENGVKWMDVVGAEDEITESKDFSEQWKVVGLFGDKKIIERL